VTLPECAREADLIDAVTTGQWPDRCDTDLLSHVSGCDGCRDLAAILVTVSDAWASTRADVRLPAPGMVWWRAQMRARQEAAAAAARPIALIQTVAGVAALTLALLGLIALGPWLAAFVEPWGALLTIDVTALPGVPGSRLLAGGVAMLLVIASLAVYVVVAEE
jgi:hypothetical protein